MSTVRVPSSSRGSGTVLVVAVLIVVLGVAATLVVVGRYVVADHRAATAADQAAFAAATAHTLGGAACPVAVDTAARNGARLTDCRVSGDAIDFVVTVTVEVDLPGGFAGLPSTIAAGAHAGRVG